MKNRVVVKCTFELIINIPSDRNNDNLYFEIEENSCPATGIVGKEFDKIYEWHKKNNTCWGCTLNGENKIVRILKKEV